MQKEKPRYTKEEREVLIKKYMKDFQMTKYEADLRIRFIFEKLVI